MTTFPSSPRLLKGGIVFVDSDTSGVLRIISLQCDPEKLTRTVSPEVVEGGAP